MTKEAIIQKTMEVLYALPADKIEEVSDFVEEEQGLYTVKDLKERYK